MSSTNSPNMGLIIPTVAVESGPTYAFDINNSLSIIDQHNHTAGSGVPITPAAININSALSFVNNFATNVAGVMLTAQSGTPAVGTVYESGTDLYFVDGLGNNVRITQAGGVAGSPGSISGLTAPASATYVAGSQTFVWQSNTSIAANMDAGSLLMRNLTPNSTFALTLAPPAAMGANFTITLPTPPGTTALLSMDSSGTIATQPLNTLVPPGIISPYAGTSAPSGYLFCDGSAQSRTTYSALFGVIGTAYGIGNGSTTFNIPDLRGMFLRGVSGASGNDPDAGSRTATNGGNAGNAVGSVQTSGFTSHNHTTTDPGHDHNSASLQPIVLGNSGTTTLQSGGAVTMDTTNAHSVSANLTGITINNTGGNETRPINVYVLYIIKT